MSEIDYVGSGWSQSSRVYRVEQARGAEGEKNFGVNLC